MPRLRTLPLILLPFLLLPFLLLPFLLLSASCEKRGPSAQTDPRLPTEARMVDDLSASDLDIKKVRLTARPSPGQVAIFRSYYRTPDAPEPMTYDQILWRADGAEISKDVVVIPRALYTDAPKPDPATQENVFLADHRIHAGLFRADLNRCMFIRGKSGNTGKDGASETEWVYTRNCKTRTEDIICRFTIFTLSFEEAKRLHPQLAENSITAKEGSWEAAFILDPGQAK